LRICKHSFRGRCIQTSNLVFCFDDGPSSSAVNAKCFGLFIQRGVAGLDERVCCPGERRTASVFSLIDTVHSSGATTFTLGRVRNQIASNITKKAIYVVRLLQVSKNSTAANWI
jgi:hypothetical protein